MWVRTARALSRRRFLRYAASVTGGTMGVNLDTGQLGNVRNAIARAAPMLSAESSHSTAWQDLPDDGRLRARPVAPTGDMQFGLQPLGLTTERDALCYIPSVYRPDTPAPFALMLHGAGGDASSGLRPWRDLAERAGLILLAPASRGKTWDVIVDESYGRDIAFIDAALTQVFHRYAINPARLAVAGFSDGASYALSLGMMNGDLFTHTVAFSPGFIAPEGLHGKPRFFVAHGTADTVLPIDECSRQIVPELRMDGYVVIYREFDGPHTVPPDIAQSALAWFTAAP